MDSFHLCHYRTYNSLFVQRDTTYCNIFSYSHLCTAKCLQQGNSRYRAYILRWHYFTQNDSLNNILMFGPLMQNLLYDTSTVISSSPKQTETQVIKIMDIILSHITICYLLCRLLPSHYMLSFDILFFSFLLLEAIVLFISGQQRTAHDANSTYLTVLLFSHILTKRHKTLLQITRLSTAHEDWTFQMLWMERDNGQPTMIQSTHI